MVKIGQFVACLHCDQSIDQFGRSVLDESMLQMLAQMIYMLLLAMDFIVHVTRKSSDPDNHTFSIIAYFTSVEILMLEMCFPMLRSMIKLEFQDVILSEADQIKRDEPVNLSLRSMDLLYIGGLTAVGMRTVPCDLTTMATSGPFRAQLS